MTRRVAVVVILACVAATAAFDNAYAQTADDQPLLKRADEALRKAVAFYRSEVGYEGAYLYRYSADLKRQEGEHDAYRTTGWTQPPGTPAVAAAYLDAYLLTGDPYLLDAARESAQALIRGQLESGGWDYKFELDPKHRRRSAYRQPPNDPEGRNYTTLDDNKSQSAVMFLMRLDEVLDGGDPAVREAARYALDRMVEAQYANGAWPQQLRGPADPDAHQPRAASIPQSYPRAYPGGDYRGHYTFNDNVMSDMLDVMLEARRIYGDAAYETAARRTGDFMLLAQLPAPQPGWAQQYNLRMEPAWARKFEPAAVTGGESQGVMRALIKLARRTGDAKYLQPLPAALAYYRKSLLPSGQLARFYDLNTNRPLYFTRRYELTYDDDDLPTHYGFKVSSKLEAIEREYHKTRKQLAKPEPSSTGQPAWRPRAPRLSDGVRRDAEAAIEAMDDRGAWLETGRLRTDEIGDEPTISTATYIRRLRELSRFIAAARAKAN